MQPVATRGLRAEIQQVFDKPQQHGADARTFIERALTAARGNVMPSAGKLHDDVMRRQCAPEQCRHADEPFGANHAYLTAGAVFHHRHYRGKPLIDKVDVLKLLTHLVQNLSFRQGYRL